MTRPVPARDHLGLRAARLACRLTEPGLPPGCGKGPFARYLWLLRTLGLADRHLIGRGRAER